jgi:hypothetical protein
MTAHFALALIAGAMTGAVMSGGLLLGAKVRGGFTTLSTRDIPTPGNVNGQACYKRTLTVTP